MPILVFIDQTNLPAYYRPQFREFVIEALQYWSGSSGGHVTFALVTARRDPCVRVQWSRDFYYGGSEVGGMAYRHFASSGGRRYLAYVDITIPTTQRGTERTDWNVKASTAHEVGHALGLGHSDDPWDAMYSACSGGGPRKTNSISARDGRSLRDLYGRESDIWEGP